mmetsp:Transcript_27322/g.40352  ORF Transcript_27322/g.40352 Transcript_27322/m.40352 type:complete len:213 (+) Transcript_27322:1006-1644(+)
MGRDLSLFTSYSRADNPTEMSQPTKLSSLLLETVSVSSSVAVYKSSSSASSIESASEKESELESVESVITGPPKIATGPLGTIVGPIRTTAWPPRAVIISPAAPPQGGLGEVKYWRHQHRGRARAIGRKVIIINNNNSRSFGRHTRDGYWHLRHQEKQPRTSRHLPTQEKGPRHCPRFHHHHTRPSISHRRRNPHSTPLSQDAQTLSHMSPQ